MNKLKTVLLLGLAGLAWPAAAQNLLMRYTFDEAASGTTAAVDSSGVANQGNGTFSGTGTRTSNTPGSFGVAAFDAGSGGGGYIDAGDVDKLDGQQKLTITAWIRLYGAPANGQFLLTKQDTGNTSGFELLYGLPSAGSIAANNFTVKLRVGTSTASGVSADLNADNTWIFVAVTYDGSAASSNLRFYNGGPSTPVGSATVRNYNAGTATANSQPFRLCASSAAAGTVSVMVDDVRIYANVLPVAQIETIRQGNVPPTLWWDRNSNNAGSTNGVGTANGVWSGSGVWTGSANWSSSSNGDFVCQQWSDGSIARFAASNDSTGTYTVTVSNTPTASAVYVEEGTLTFNRTAVNLTSGAIMDVASGASATFDSTTLGGTVGFTKTSGGTLTLGQTNSVSGNVTINAGTVALGATGALPSVSIISVTNGATYDVSAVSGGYALGSGQTLRGTGLVKGGVSVSSGGTVAPGYSIGTLTFNTNALTFNSGSTNVMEINRSGPSSDLLTGIGSLTEGGTLLVSNPGATLQIGDSFALLSATNYAGAFAALSPASPNSDPDLAWDTTALRNSGLLRVHHVPPANDKALTRGNGLAVKVKLSDLFSAVDPADGDAVYVGSFTSGSQGATIVTNDTYIFYTPANDNNDAFTYTVTDFRGGTRTKTITVTVADMAGYAQQVNGSPSSVTVSFAAVPGLQYDVQRDTNVNFPTPITLLTTNVPTHGLFNFTDASPPSPSFYRLKYHP